MLCIHYGKMVTQESHFPTRAAVLKGVKGFSSQKERSVNLPGWTKKNLIFPLSPYWELKLK